MTKLLPLTEGGVSTVKKIEPPPEYVITAKHEERKDPPKTEPLPEEVEDTATITERTIPKDGNPCPL